MWARRALGYVEQLRHVERVGHVRHIEHVRYVEYFRSVRLFFILCPCLVRVFAEERDSE